MKCNDCNQQIKIAIRGENICFACYDRRVKAAETFKPAVPEPLRNQLRK